MPRGPVSVRSRDRLDVQVPDAGVDHRPGFTSLIAVSVPSRRAYRACRSVQQPVRPQIIEGPLLLRLARVRDQLDAVGGAYCRDLR